MGFDLIPDCLFQFIFPFNPSFSIFPLTDSPGHSYTHSLYSVCLVFSPPFVFSFYWLISLYCLIKSPKFLLSFCQILRPLFEYHQYSVYTFSSQMMYHMKHFLLFLSSPGWKNSYKTTKSTQTQGHSFQELIMKRSKRSGPWDFKSENFYEGRLEKMQEKKRKCADSFSHSQENLSL